MDSDQIFVSTTLSVACRGGKVDEEAVEGEQCWASRSVILELRTLVVVS